MAAKEQEDAEGGSLGVVIIGRDVQQKTACFRNWPLLELSEVGLASCHGFTPAFPLRAHFWSSARAAARKMT